jgi:hypothetical protein
MSERIPSRRRHARDRASGSNLEPSDKKALAYAAIACAVFVAACLLDMTPLYKDAQGIVPALNVSGIAMLIIAWSIYIRSLAIGP